MGMCGLRLRSDLGESKAGAERPIPSLQHQGNKEIIGKMSRALLGWVSKGQRYSYAKMGKASLYIDWLAGSDARSNQGVPHSPCPPPCTHIHGHCQSLPCPYLSEDPRASRLSMTDFHRPSCRPLPVSTALGSAPGCPSPLPTLDSPLPHGDADNGCVPQPVACTALDRCEVAWGDEGTGVLRRAAGERHTGLMGE